MRSSASEQNFDAVNSAAARVVIKSIALRPSKPRSRQKYTCNPEAGKRTPSHKV